MVGHVHLTLPLPPAVNNLFYTHGNTRHPSARYRAWQTQAAAELFHAARVPGHFEAHLQFQRPDRRKRDLDGLAKAPLDALKKAGVIVDDSLAQRITLEWAPGDPVGTGARVHVWLTPVADPEALRKARAA